MAASKPPLWPACAPRPRRGSHVRRTSQISRVAVALFDAFKRADSAPASVTPLFTGYACCGSLAWRLATGGRQVASKSRAQVPSWSHDSSGWSNQDWELLALAVRYHRGAEPGEKDGPFSKLSAEQQNSVRALAGILRLARALRKCGVASGAGLRAEKSTDAIVLRVPD